LKLFTTSILTKFCTTMKTRKYLVLTCCHTTNSGNEMVPSCITATTSLPNVNNAKRWLTLFGHVVRLDVSTPVHQILQQAVDIKSGSRPNAKWWRHPGRPRNTWLQQISNEYQCRASGSPGELLGIAVIDGHRRSSLRASARYVDVTTYGRYSHINRLNSFNRLATIHTPLSYTDRHTGREHVG